MGTEFGSKSVGKNLATDRSFCTVFFFFAKMMAVVQSSSGGMTTIQRGPAGQGHRAAVQPTINSFL